jgi:formylglycine-generating enzyme required for sulfatase activity
MLGKKLFSVISLALFVFIGNTAFASCPSADLTGDCFVDMEDFVLMTIQWLTTDSNVPDDMVYIPDGEFEMGDHHDGFPGELPIHLVLVDAFFMGKFEIANQQYCDYLNSAKDAGDIKVDEGVVYASSDSGNNRPYCSTSSAPVDYPDFGQCS